MELFGRVPGDVLALEGGLTVVYLGAPQYPLVNSKALEAGAESKWKKQRAAELRVPLQFGEKQFLTEFERDAVVTAEEVNTFGGKGIAIVACSASRWIQESKEKIKEVKEMVKGKDPELFRQLTRKEFDLESEESLYLVLRSGTAPGCHLYPPGTTISRLEGPARLLDYFPKPTDGEGDFQDDIIVIWALTDASCFTVDLDQKRGILQRKSFHHTDGNYSVSFCVTTALPHEQGGSILLVLCSLSGEEAGEGADASGEAGEEDIPEQAHAFGSKVDGKLLST